MKKGFLFTFITIMAPPMTCHTNLNVYIVVGRMDNKTIKSDMYIDTFFYNWRTIFMAFLALISRNTFLQIEKGYHQ